MSQMGINFRSGDEGRYANSQFRAVLVHNQGFQFEPPLSGTPPQFVSRAPPFLERAMEDVSRLRAAPASRCWTRRSVICLRAWCSSPLLQDHSGLDASLGRYKSFTQGAVDAPLSNWDEDKVLFAAFAGT